MIFGASGSVGVGILADLFGWASAFLALAGILGVILLALGGAAVRRQIQGGAGATPAGHQQGADE
jgi:hypothetical protein